MQCTQTPLTPPFKSPHCMVSHHEKYFTVDLGGRHDNFSVDHLKPAIVETEFELAAWPQHSQTA